MNEKTATEFLKMIEGFSLRSAMAALNQVKKGAYSLKAKNSATWNEVRLELWESTISKPVATAFVDKGHTREDRKNAVLELVGTARVFLRLE